MPKMKIRWGVPIWDALVAELGDPRPYEPTMIGAVVVSDEPCVDQAAFDAGVTDLNDDVERFWHYADELTRDAQLELDVIFPLDEVDDALEARARWRHAQLRTGQTVVIPIWPGVDALVDVEETQS